MQNLSRAGSVMKAAREIAKGKGSKLMNAAAVINWPLPNLWFGVTCENQKTADERIPILLQIPAAVRYVSCEPLLEEIDIRKYLIAGADGLPDEIEKYHDWIDWTIVGGESGPKARPMDIEWARSIRDQCQDAGVPFFFKQWGEWLPAGQEQMANIAGDNDEIIHADSNAMFRVGKKRAGHLLNGEEIRQWPERTG